ncbi:unnamed protein product [Blepharisma stoltei]|uniref:DUF295 domain-containing protein n=1 Tax=Blepharisma stoltei TaxID=1481888 RepID=A0AAU9ICJ6_9CILI|nr:unnamed protein product [Blepharisma stoltei]
MALLNQINMKLNQIVDKEVDQNGIESEYLWDLSKRESWLDLNRVNLSTFEVDFSFSGWAYIKNLMTLPNNQFFGLKIRNSDNDHDYLFISDKKVNVKIIEKFPKNPYDWDLISCFYDDSIFIFACYEQEGKFYTCAKRYIISQNKWIYFSSLDFGIFNSCIGLKQKIIIIQNGSESGAWVYDILLDNYYFYKNIRIGNLYFCTFIQDLGKIYLIGRDGEFDTELYNIHTFDDPLSEWTFLGYYNNIPICNYFTHYKGSIYFVRDQIYEFSLKNFETRKIFNNSKFKI